MDIITSIIVSIAYMSLYIVSIAHITPGKASLGVAYLRAGSCSKFWGFIAGSTVTNVALFYFLPTWLTVPLIALGAVVMVGGAIYLRRAQRQEAKREIEMKLELIAEARALNAEARRAAEAGKIMRAHYLTEQARDIHARIEI